MKSNIQPRLDRRRPGQSKFTSQRQEADQVKILSGTFEGLTTGAPISLIIENTDARSKDYDDVKDKFRPGHADYTYQAKYGIRDYRGGGQLGEKKASRTARDWNEVNNNPFFCPDKKAATAWADYLDGIRKEGSS